jgi:hypothetical protein
MIGILRNEIARMAQVLEQAACSEKRRAADMALNALIGLDGLPEDNRAKAFGAYEGHRAYLHCVRELDGLRKRIDSGEFTPAPPKTKV